ncbi:integrase core domain-containing protein [Miniimonas arenae]|uniref:integrase core domain-containing protein n=1 Tax=Miniimonas arenae TaxID=676201 RepID=UPI0028AB63C2|nr:integrase core domain-containing protein [Miniimonas arenae]
MRSRPRASRSSPASTRRCARPPRRSTRRCPRLSRTSSWRSSSGSSRTSTCPAVPAVRPAALAVGDALDNALMESTIGLFKTEIHAFVAELFTTWRDVEKATAAWVHWFNHDRLHSAIGDVPPIELETGYYAATTSPGEPAAA